MIVLDVLTPEVSQRRSSSSAGRKAEEGSAGWLERGKGEGDDRWGPPVGVTERVKG